VTTLVLWVPEEMSPYTDTPAATLLAERLEAFNQNQTDLQVEVLVKKAHGRGGLLDFLRTASAAAPSVLPDLVVLDLEDIRVASQAGLLQPLDGLLPPSLGEDRYPFAMELGQVGEQTMGMPLAIELEHLAYRPALVPTPPVTWTDVLSAGVPFVFPAAGHEGKVNGATLVQYLGAGGRLTDGEGNPLLEAEPLTAVLEFYARAADIGVVPSTTVLSLVDVDGCWEALQSGQAAMAVVGSHRYWTERPPSLAPAPVPTRNGRVVALAQGWLVSLVTADPQRQMQAMALLAWLMTPEGYGAWTQSAGYLPATRGGLATWTVSEQERAVLEALLEGAQPAPPSPVQEAVGPPIQTALEAVLTGRRTPAEAAEQAVRSIRP